ncbi:MAG: DedA family protein [Actinomycetes bacterium]
MIRSGVFLLGMTMASIVHGQFAYLLVGLVIGIESMGIPLPGETTLFLASFAAHDGTLTIEWVILAAALGAIIGDNLGYWIGRKGGRALLERQGPFYERRMALLIHGDRFFEAHGPKAVFLGRWVALLRVTAAVLAGANRMEWRKFFLWNALGGVAWATTMGLAGYYAGHAAEKLIHSVGVGALIAVVVAVVGLLAYLYLRERRALQGEMAEVARREETGEPMIEWHDEGAVHEPEGLE